MKIFRIIKIWLYEKNILKKPSFEKRVRKSLYKNKKMAITIDKNIEEEVVSILKDMDDVGYRVIPSMYTSGLDINIWLKENE